MADFARLNPATNFIEQPGPTNEVANMASPRHYHFVTGKLAAASLRRVAQELSESQDFSYSIQVMPITVAALLTPAWIAPRLTVPAAATDILLPGYCDTELTPITDIVDIPVHVGPRDLRALPDYFGQPRQESYGRYSIEIIAEINHAPRLTRQAILEIAAHYRDSGADIIDLGCDPQQDWSGAGECVRALKDAGHRVSIDSLRPSEIQRATDAGAELVLSVNSSNRHAAADFGCEVVVIPDEPRSLAGFHDTIEYLAQRRVPMRLDPILEPIGCGFADSLTRYHATRQQYPDAEVMMGVGNLTELTDVDSAGVNVLLLGICEELGIRSVLTTEVIHWARSSVAECDIARRLVRFAVDHQCPPKHVEDRLVMLRDAQLYPPQEGELQELAAQLRDNNYRIFTEGDQLRLLAAGVNLTADNAFALLHQLMAMNPQNLDAAHAFYLGYELAKATTAITLGKHYRQDQALDWGLLTQAEESHRQRKASGR